MSSTVRDSGSFAQVGASSFPTLARLRSNTATLIYYELNRRCFGKYRESWECTASDYELAKLLGCTRKGAQLAIEKLLGAGLIMRNGHDSRYHGANRYIVVDRSPPKLIQRALLANSSTLAKPLANSGSRAQPTRVPATSELEFARSRRPEEEQPRRASPLPAPPDPGDEGDDSQTVKAMNEPWVATMLRKRAERLAQERAASGDTAKRALVEAQRAERAS